MSTRKFSDVNLYELLGVELECEQLDIRKAYRRKALECHPDKNPDNPQAAELFHDLSKALEILTDPKARATYDKVLNAKKAAQLRTKQLDSKRQKLKSDLEQRERDALHKVQASQSYSTVQKSDEDILLEQIERLQREGSKLLEEENRLMREQLQRREVPIDTTQYRLKIKWKADKKDAANGGYTQAILQNYLKKYGDIVALVMSKKSGSALVEFNTVEAAEMALAYEKGRLENPLQVEWVICPKPKTSAHSSSVTNLDFEDLVLRKLRQIDERMHLIEKMKKEDEEEAKKHANN